MVKIKSPAIRTGGKIYTGKNHASIENRLTDKKTSRLERGFITDQGKFVNRTAAGKIAYNAGQTNKHIKQLHSHNLKLA